MIQTPKSATTNPIAILQVLANSGIGIVDDGLLSGDRPQGVFGGGT